MAVCLYPNPSLVFPRGLLQQGVLIGVLEVAASGQSARQAGNPDIIRSQLLLDIHGRGVAFHTRIGRQDDLFHVAAGNTFN